MCVSSVKGMERPTQDPVLSYPSPTDLQYVELGSREVRLRWTPPHKGPQQYRVVYHTSEGQSLKEVSNRQTQKINKYKNIG